ncbi:MFS transporter [Paraburkholderia fungorum]|uniref:MFS transporter n=1 Tax=Paraburkholderia fungorum TaxID=134537 RepID=UPI0038B80B3F
MQSNLAPHTQPASNSCTGASSSVISALEVETMRKVSKRLVPFLLIAYLVSVIDRTNIGFAAMQMSHDVGLSQSMFGLAGGIFFVSYFICEVPSNLALERFGARRWLSRIMVSWGLVAGASALVIGPKTFFTARFVLGVAEAGFLPGAIYYLTNWFPSAYRSRVMAWFVLSVPAAGLLGSPISGALLNMGGLMGLRGWQWLFVIEAIPAILLGIFALYWLTDSPAQARWLSAEQRDWLVTRLAGDENRRHAPPKVSLWKVLSDWRVLMLTLVCGSTVTVSTVLGFWQPLIIRSFGVSYFNAGLLTALPYGAAALAMILWGRMSDRHGERIWFNVIPMTLAVIGMVGTLYFSSLIATVILFVLVMVGTYACKGPFWALATESVPATVAAAGIAQINALGSLPGFFASSLIGAIRQSTGSYPLAILPIAVFCAMGVVAVAMIGRLQSKARWF